MRRWWSALRQVNEEMRFPRTSPFASYVMINSLTLGARHLVEKWNGSMVLPQAGIIGEPTSLTVVRMHKGHIRIRLTVTGIPAHSGLPYLGRNAVEAAGAAIAALRNLENERPPYSEHFPEVPFVTLNIARVAGGGALNVVPAQCTIELGLRLLPDMVAADMAARVREAVNQALDDVPFSLEVTGESPPMVTAAEAPRSSGELAR
jgi:acetylornithine deacetylase/succinyl-diaminopimelate desuccinylase-like protein